MFTNSPLFLPQLAGGRAKRGVLLLDLLKLSELDHVNVIMCIVFVLDCVSHARYKLGKVCFSRYLKT